MTPPQPPLGVRYRRAIRGFRRAPLPMQAAALAAAVILLADVIALGAVGGSSHPGGRLASVGPGGVQGTQSGLPATASSGPGGTTPGLPGATAAGRLGPGAGSVTGIGGAGGAVATGGVGSGIGPGGVKLTATDRGVTPTSIRIVTPYPDLGPIGAATGLNTSSEDPKQSILTYVNDINNHGGILGRRLDPEIVSYNPLDEADMRNKCLQWTQDQKVFAVVDTFGWHDDQQLCITQENHTPLISGWTTVPDWTQRGAPYLWWTGPDDALVVQNLIGWAKAHHAVNPAVRFGVVAADRESDTLALNNYLLPALKRAGLTNFDVETMHYSTTDNGAAGGGQAGVAIAKFRSANVTTVLPLLPFPSLAEFINGAQAQNYYPRYLLSDYESGLSAGLGLADAADQKSLQDMNGPTSFVLGNADYPKGYDPQAMDCYNVWRQTNGTGPAQSGGHSPYLESTGTAMTWCQNLRLFAAAARVAGTNLTRADWAGAMATLGNFGGTVIPSLSYGPGVYAGPHLARTVAIHENQDGKCPLKFDGGAQGSCWLIQDDWQPMQRV